MRRNQRALTARESEIVELLCKRCLSTREVADRLRLSIKTVETHKTNIMRKVGVHSTAELCRWWWNRREA